MSNLSDLLPAGAAAKQLTFTDSGSGISSKAPVILNSDGTVSEVSGSSTVIGSATNILADVMTPIVISEITGTAKTYAGFHNYNGGSNKGTGFILSASSNAITVGAGADFASVEPYYPINCYDSVNSRIVQCWQETGGTRYLKVCVGSVSGTTITWGTPVTVKTFSGTLMYYARMAFDPDSGNFCIFYMDGANSNYGTAHCGTVQSGTTTVTMGSSDVVINSAYSSLMELAYDTTQNRFIFIYDQGGNSFYTRAVTCSGSDSTATISSIGSAVEIGSGDTVNGWPLVVHDSTAGKNIIAYIKSGTGLNALTATIDASTNAVTLGTINTVLGSVPTSDSLGLAYDPNVNKTILVYREAPSPYYSYYIELTVSGSDITASSSTVLYSANSQYKGLAYNATEQEIVIVIGDNTAYNTGFVFIPGSTNLTAQAFVGVADSAISASAAGSVIVQGGTVSGVSSGTGVSAGTAVQYSASNLADIYAADSVYDSTNNKIVVVYDGAGSGAGYGIVGTISGTSVSYGSAVQYSGGNAYFSRVTYDSTNQRVVVAYADTANSNYLTGVVGTVSGTSISWGTPVVADSTASDFYTGIDFDINAGKVLIIWKDNVTAYNYSIVGTVSGTSISFGTRVLVDGSWGYQQTGGLTYDENAQKHLFTRNRTGVGADAYVGTISGTSVSWGSATNFSTTEYLYNLEGSYDSNAQKIAVNYRDASASAFSSQVATISGTSVSLGTRAVIDSTISPDFTGSYYDSSDQTIVAFARATNYYGYIGTISGTSISWSSASTLLLDAAFGYGLGTPAYDANADKGLILFANAGDSAAESAVTTAGALPLTTGTKYYVTTSGGFSSSADTPSVNAGLAISTTSLLLNGDS